MGRPDGEEQLALSVVADLQTVIAAGETDGHAVGAVRVVSRLDGHFVVKPFHIVSCHRNIVAAMNRGASADPVEILFVAFLGIGGHVFFADPLHLQRLRERKGRAFPAYTLYRHIHIAGGGFIGAQRNFFCAGCHRNLPFGGADACPDHRFFAGLPAEQGEGKNGVCFDFEIDMVFLFFIVPAGPAVGGDAVPGALGLVGNERVPS